VHGTQVRAYPRRARGNAGARESVLDCIGLRVWCGSTHPQGKDLEKRSPDCAWKPVEQDMRHSAWRDTAIN